MDVLSLSQIKQCIDIETIIQGQEEGFKAYCQGRSNIPPVGYLSVPEQCGEYHLKYGMLQQDDVFVVKLAGAFYQNPKRYALPSTQGLMLIFCAKTGVPLMLLQDEGYLTNLRTAAAGFIVAKYLAPKTISAIGVLGTGIQARMQVQLLKEGSSCRNLWVWGRSAASLSSYAEEMRQEGFNVHIAQDAEDVAQHCNFIITTTAANATLLHAANIKPGTHITAVGADAPGKRELDPEIFGKASICVVDSKSPCLDHGEISHAVNAKIVDANQIIELGQILLDTTLGRDSMQTDQITVADLTGVAFQDIQIAKAVKFKFDSRFGQIQSDLRPSSSK